MYDPFLYTQQELLYLVMSNWNPLLEPNRDAAIEFFRKCYNLINLQNIHKSQNSIITRKAFKSRLYSKIKQGNNPAI